MKCIHCMCNCLLETQYKGCQIRGECAELHFYTNKMYKVSCRITTAQCLRDREAHPDKTIKAVVYQGVGKIKN